MKLNVPLIIQPKDSVYCGNTGVAMLLQYYGINKDLSKLTKEITTDTTGTYAPQLGTYLLKKGFEVSIITHHPKLFTKKDVSLTQIQIMGRFRKKYELSTSPQDKKVLNYFIDFMKKGGKIIVRIPNIQDVEKEIRAHRPTGAVLTTNFIHGNKSKFNFHFNIITGFDNKYIYVNDPNWNETGGKKRYLYNDFLYGLYASTYGDLDNGCLLIVKKKR